MSAHPVIVVGAGPSGLIQALYLAQIKRRRVIVVEQQASLGGIFSSVQTPWGLVDQGIHIVQETGNPVLDGLLYEILPREDWQVLDGVRKDIAGNLFEHRIDQGSIFPDLRRLPAEDYLRGVGEIFARIRTRLPGIGDVPHLGAFLEARFGPHLTERVYRPLATKFWQQPLERLSPWAAKVVHMARVVTHDAEAALSLKASPALDAVVGFPEQLMFPEEMLSHHRSCLYPRRFGTSGIVDGLCRALRRNGAEFLTSSKVTQLERAGHRIVATHVQGASGGANRIETAGVLWTSPQPILCGLLGQRIEPPANPPLPHRVVHLFLDRPPSTGELYYLWSYDSDNVLIRVSNPTAYCPDAASSGWYPLCVEMHVPDAGIDDAGAITLAEQESRRCGLMGAAVKVVGGAVLAGVRGFFPPTLANCEAQAAQRESIRAAGIGNLALSCQDISSGVFYLPDILNASVPLLESL